MLQRLNYPRIPFRPLHKKGEKRILKVLPLREDLNGILSLEQNNRKDTIFPSLQKWTENQVHESSLYKL